MHIPADTGEVLPGNYMLFALKVRQGEPSVAKVIQITAAGAPRSSTVDTQTATVGGVVKLRLVAKSATGPLSYRATGLPPGLSINAATGVIRGTVNTIGQFAVTAHATNRVATTSTAWLWNVTPRSRDTLVGEPLAGEIACTDVAPAGAPAGARPCEQH